MTDNGETPRTPRLNAATLAQMQHEERMAQAARSSEPSASAAIETTAKGEPKPDVKLYAPLGCDYDALQAHAQAVTDIAVEAYGRAVTALAKIAAETPFV